MATYTNDLRLKEIGTGDEDGTWGTSTNANLSLIADAFGYGTKQMAADADETFTMPDATADGTRAMYLKITSAVSLSTTRTVTLGPNTISKVWIIENATSGSQSITISQGSGGSVTIATGTKAFIYTDGAGAGAAVVLANPTTATQAYPGAGVAVSTGSAWGTSLAAPSGALVGTTDTQTLTTKRIDPRVVSAASASTLTPDIAAADQYAYTALAAGLTINAPTGTPVDGNKLIFRLLDNGTARALTWNGTYTVIGVTLPTTTVINKTTYVGCIYNANNTRWDVIAVTTQA